MVLQPFTKHITSFKCDEDIRYKTLRSYIKKNLVYVSKIWWFVGKLFMLFFLGGGIRCYPEGKFKTLLFPHSWTTQAPQSTLFYWNMAYDLCAILVRSWEIKRVTHFPHWVITFRVISIYLIIMESYWHRLSHFVSHHWQNAQESFKLKF